MWRGNFIMVLVLVMPGKRVCNENVGWDEKRVAGHYGDDLLVYARRGTKRV